MFSGEIVRGEQYDVPRPCIVVFVFDFIELAGEELHSVFSIRDERRNEKLCDHFELHFIQLPNLMNTQNHDDEQLLRAWCKFLTASSEADLE